MCQPTFLPPSLPDNAARRRVSYLLRQFAARRCDSEELTEWYGNVARSSDDLTLQKLLDENWLFLQEAEEWFIPWKDTWRRGGMGMQYESGQIPPMRKEDRQGIARWVFFLRSDAVYQWPTWNGRALLCRNARLLLTWLTLGLIKFRGLRNAEYGDLDVWPFLNRAEYEAALKTPGLLCGRKAI